MRRLLVTSAVVAALLGTTAPAGMKAGRSYVLALDRLLRDLGYRA